MSPTNVDRVRRRLHEAEGYLELDLPGHSLEILESCSDWPGLQFEACLIKGEALRRLDRYRESIQPLEIAAGLRPDDSRVALALGWCYKRTSKLAQAIDALERARRHDPDNALLHYNLACYWSLAGHPSRAIGELSAALELEADLKKLIADEPDFEKLRGNPEFERLIPKSTPQK